MSEGELSYLDTAQILGRLGVNVVEISDEQAYAGVVRWAGEGRYTDALVDIWRAVREGRLATVSDGVKRILDRKAIPFNRWAEENANAFQSWLAWPP